MVLGVLGLSRASSRAMNQGLQALVDKYAQNLDDDITRYQKAKPNKLSAQDQAYYIPDLNKFMDGVSKLERTGG